MCCSKGIVRSLQGFSSVFKQTLFFFWCTYKQNWSQSSACTRTLLGQPSWSAKRFLSYSPLLSPGMKKLQGRCSASKVGGSVPKPSVPPALELVRCVGEVWRQRQSGSCWSRVSPRKSLGLELLATTSLGQRGWNLISCVGDPGSSFVSKVGYII